MIRIPISWGELFDKISILEIKQKKIIDPEKLIYINIELKELKNLIPVPIRVKTLALHIALKTINEKLWDVEDKLRIMERDQTFGEPFIELARNVYFWNDKRFSLKNAINKSLNSEFREIKEYVKYDTRKKED